MSTRNTGKPLGPRMAKKVRRAERDCRTIGNERYTLTNYLDHRTGEPTESKTRFFVPFGYEFPEWTASVQERMTKLAARFEPLHAGNYRTYITKLAELKAELEQNIPTKDERQSLEELETQAAGAAERVAEMEDEQAKADQLRQRFDGFTGRLITIAKEYDDSDIMTDYFGTRTLATWVLARTHEQRDMISLLKAAANKYPGLRAFEWEEHREKYSMGRGYYITTKATIPDAEPVKNYGGHMAYPYYMISFDTVHGAGGYPDWPEEPDTPKPQQLTQGNGATVTLNQERSGVEVRFSAKPPEETRSALKSHGFRWSRPQRLWYAKQSPDRIAFAESLAS